MHKSNLVSTIDTDYIMAHNKPEIKDITVFLNISNI